MASYNLPSWPISVTAGSDSTPASGSQTSFVGALLGDNSALVDTEDMVCAFVPGFSAAMLAGTSIGLTQANLNPYSPYQTWSGAAQNYAGSSTVIGGVSIMNAILIEARVFVALLAWQMMDQGPDAGQLRADELNNLALGTGAV